jgi:hypothetical protein
MQGFKLILVDSVDSLTKFSNILNTGHCQDLGAIFQKISDEVDVAAQAAWEENAKRGLIQDDMPYTAGMEKGKRRAALIQEMALSGKGEATYYILLEPKVAKELRSVNRSLVLSQAGKHAVYHGTMKKLLLPEAAWFLACGIATLIEGEVDVFRHDRFTWNHLPTSFTMMDPKDVDEERTYVCQSKGPTGFVTWISQDVDQIVLVVTEGPTIRLVSYSPTNAFSKEAALGEVRRLYEDAPLVQLHEEFEDFQLHAAGCDPVKEIV